LAAKAVVVAVAKVVVIVGLPLVAASSQQAVTWNKNEDSDGKRRQ
jgi:hypothetical protein